MVLNTPLVRKLAELLRHELWPTITDDQYRDSKLRKLLFELDNDLA